MSEDVDIPEGTRPLAVYKHEGHCVKVLIPGSPMIVLHEGDSFTFTYKVDREGPGMPLRFRAVDG